MTAAGAPARPAIPSPPGSDDNSVRPATRVLVDRGGVVESRHAVHWVVRREGRTLGAAGDPARVTFARSAAKPFQALPLVEDGVWERLGLGGAELAVACASHNSEPEHMAAVQAILAAAGVGEEALACGGHWPLLPSVALRFAAEGRRPRSVESNCSGKHAGMLALARHHGWSTEGYHRRGHPVQERMTEEMARWTGVTSAAMGLGTDGCGVVCHAVPLAALADAYADLGRASTAGGGPAAVVEAMTTHPFLVAGTDRLDTALMASVPGTVAKVGAEGVYGAAVPALGLGIAVKVEDGHRRAADPVLLQVLGRFGVLPEVLPGELEPFLAPAVTNTRGEVVGRIRVATDGPGA